MATQNAVCFFRVADILNTRNNDVDIIAIRTDNWTDVNLTLSSRRASLSI